MVPLLPSALYAVPPPPAASPAASPAAFALALERLEGVGRVTAGRLLAHFAAHEELLTYPREQVLLRIKGTPNAEAIVKRLFDAEAMRALLEQGHREVAHLQKQRVQVLTAQHEHWPKRLDDLPRGHRPAVLYVFGDSSALRRPLIAFFAQPPLREAPFERAQSLVHALPDRAALPATGAAHGFDVVVHKVAASPPRPMPSVLVAHCGLSKVPPPIRPIASRSVKAGGALLSPFPMQHGPFDHDERLRVYVLAALARVCIFLDPAEDSYAWEAMTWALESGRPVFGTAPPDTALPDRVQRFAGDLDAILASLS